MANKPVYIFNKEILTTGFPQPPIFWLVRGEPMVQQMNVGGELRLIDSKGEIHHEHAYDFEVGLALSSIDLILDPDFH